MCGTEREREREMDGWRLREVERGRDSETERETEREGGRDGLVLANVNSSVGLYGERAAMLELDHT